MKIKGSLPNKIFLALISGIAFGLAAHSLLPIEYNDFLFHWLLQPGGSIFLKLLQIITFPLVACAIVRTTAEIGSIKKLCSMVGKAILVYLTLIVSALAAAIIFANIMMPGAGLSLVLPQEYRTAEVSLLNNIFESILPVIVISILFGLSISFTTETSKPILTLVKQANTIIAKAYDLLMTAAPFGIFALTTGAFVLQGISVFVPLMKYALTILIVFLFQMLIVYSYVLKKFGKMDPLLFYKTYWPVMTLAFGTGSYGSLPANIDACQNKLSAPESIVNLTLPLGTAFHMSGTAIMTGVAALFSAQLFGLELTPLQQLGVILMAAITSIGTAGVPGLHVITSAMVLQQLGIPLEGIALIFAADRILEMFGTVVNVTGNTVGTVIVSQWEKE